MKVVVKLVIPEGYNKFMSLDENEMIIEENNERMLIETKYRDRINSLISLFSLKKEWKHTETETSLYNVVFEDKGEIENFCFDEVPSNWNMFLGYLFRLVGDFL